MRMTNEVAISIITTIKGIITNDNSWTDEAKIAVKDAFDLAIEALEERPQGEWLTIDAFVVKCSICGVESFATPFCPRCGADMRKGGAE